ncbi:MAG: hypothetical protein JNL70_22945 [Saprospiraceae bacterium]|nr:hypothetical protein [Saprospiraceae bacterium]
MSKESVEKQKTVEKYQLLSKQNRRKISTLARVVLIKNVQLMLRKSCVSSMGKYYFQKPQTVEKYQFVTFLTVKTLFKLYYGF